MQHGTGIGQGQGDSQSKCPVNHHAGVVNPHAIPIVQQQASLDQNESCGGCPVQHPPSSSPPPPSSSVVAPAASSGCPVRNKEIYNVYGEKINPTNQMPPPITNPWPGQKITISTDRQTSIIPKGGTENTWVFPSPQMFYNALQRKNKAEGVTEEDAETMVYVHNTMNENTWRQVLHWEKLHHQECADPRLHWFVGRPHDLSPKAKLWSFFGWDKPFDRHDWVVDRCGKSVRYVIDFYSREASTNTTGNPSAFPTSSLYADVRPALDSFESFFDRVKHLFKSFGSKTGNEFAYNKPSPVAKSPNKIEDRDYTTEKRSLPIAVATTERIREKCHKYTEALLACRDEKEYENARTKVDLCVGRAVCPNEVKTFEESLQTSTPEDLEKGYRNILKCVTSFNVWLSESLALAQPPQSSDKKPPSS